MYTAACVRRHINNITDSKPFSIRDFLVYGSRNAVDQVFFRLVHSGYIIRVARGLFIKNNALRPSILEVATAKAAAFGKKIVEHGLEAATILGISTKITNHHTYACSGRSSSFRFGDIRIYLVGTSSRKMFLANHPVGLAIRALWQMGREHCNANLASMAVASFNRHDRETLRQSAKIMPAWMHNYFSLARLPVAKGIIMNLI